MILIIYGSKYGSTKTCVEYLQTKLTEPVDVCNIGVDKVPNLTKYNKIIIGGSVYAGKVKKEIQTLCSSQYEILKNKPVGLFIVSSKVVETSDEIFQVNFKEVNTLCKVKGSFGGEFKFDRMNFFEKMIIKLISKKEVNTIPKIQYRNIDNFVELFNIAQ